MQMNFLPKSFDSTESRPLGSSLHFKILKFQFSAFRRFSVSALPNFPLFPALRSPITEVASKALLYQRSRRAVFILTIPLFLCLARAEDDKPTKLDVLRAQYESKKAEASSAVVALKTRYTKQLEDLQTTAQAAGDLELVLAARAEAKDFLLRPAGPIVASSQAALARLQKIYSEQLVKVVAECDTKMVPVSVAYRERLDILIKELTKEGDLELAVEAKKELAQIDQITASHAPRIHSGKVVGRYVRVEIAGNSLLCLAEVEVFSESRNVAPRGKATQSSDYDQAPRPTTADKAIDGNTNGELAAGSVTHTKLDINPWWEVDLQKDRELSKIVIWNRSERQQRLDGFKLSVLSAERKVIWEIEVPKAPQRSMEFTLKPK